MTNREFSLWLDDEINNGRLLPGQKDELIGQKQAFDANKSVHQRKDFGRVVGYSHGRPFVGDSVHEVLAGARNAYPNEMVYFEPIGFDLF